MQKANFLPQIVFEKPKFKKIMQSDWFRVLSVTTQELDFSKPCIFYRFSKVMYHLKSKNHINGPILTSIAVLPVFSKQLGHA